MLKCPEDIKRKYMTQESEIGKASGLQRIDIARRLINNEPVDIDEFLANQDALKPPSFQPAVALGRYKRKALKNGKTRWSRNTK